MSASIPPGSCMARIMLFTGGPTTEGMGKIVNRDLTEEVRRCGCYFAVHKKQIVYRYATQQQQEGRKGCASL